MPGTDDTGSAAALIGFLEDLITAGDLKTFTGQARKSAVREVLSTAEGEGWEWVDLNALDLDDTIQRFEARRTATLSPASINTYKSRFRRAVEDYESFRAEPDGWSPSVRTRARRASGTLAQSDRPGRSNLSRRSRIVAYPFPVRDGILAMVELPVDLTAQEARRFGAFIASLAVDADADDERHP
jgi:hypothetical protein